MNRKTQTRWLNEYLDGEIGLADKAELERQMAEQPELRQEYKELRSIGLLMGSMPEVDVHPYNFRRKVQAELDNRSGIYFTPQRAFAASMVFSLVIICLSFGLFFYHQTLVSNVSGTAVSADVPAGNLSSVLDLTMDSGIPAERFFDRLALETQIGLADPALMSIMLNQTTVFEGASCTDARGLETTRFPAPLPISIRIKLLPHQARDLAAIAEGVSGRSVAIEGPDGLKSMPDLLQRFNPDQMLTLCIKFR